VGAACLVAGSLGAMTISSPDCAAKDLDKAVPQAAASATKAYVLPGCSGSDRPVAFSTNGGPDAASAYLNLAALGPKRIDFGRDGIFASDSAALADKANSWLDFTDLVFIDAASLSTDHALSPLPGQ
jgi:carboxypeptidase C (cathepsin A)